MESDTEKADKASRSRAMATPFLGLVVMLAHQGVFFNWDWEVVNFLAMAIWTALALGVLVLALSGGSWLIPKSVRTLVNDEVTRANRDRAVMRGFIVAMITAILVFVVAPFEPLSAQRAAHMIVSLGLAMTLLSFGIEEMRSLG